jgi:hypothetical protein
MVGTPAAATPVPSAATTAANNTSMDAILMSSGAHPTEEELLRYENQSLKTLVSAESERVAHMGAELARLHAALIDANAAYASVQQLREERDELRRRLDEQLQFRREPIESQLAEANRVAGEQRAQFRAIVDMLASQRDWVKEWALQCQENMRLKERLQQRQAGTEVNELRRQALDSYARFAELHTSFKQRGVMISVLESKNQTLALENKRLVDNAALHSEQIRRLWRRIAACPSATPAEKQAAARALRKTVPVSVAAEAQQKRVAAATSSVGGAGGAAAGSSGGNDAPSARF